MVKEFEKAIRQIEKLSADRQAELARLIEEEIRWDTSFKETQNELSTLAREARQEYRKGNISNKDW